RMKRSSDSLRVGGSGYDVRQHFHITSSTSSGDVGLRHSVSAVSITGGNGALSPASVVNSNVDGHGSSDGDCETVGSDNSGGRLTPSYFEMGGLPTTTLLLSSVEHSPVGMHRQKQRERRWWLWWSGVGILGRRVAGEEDIPLLTLLLLRLTSTTASGLAGTGRWQQLRRYLLHPRTVSVLGGVAAVASSVGFAVTERDLAINRGYDFPCFLQVLVQTMTAIILELSTGRHGFFCRSADSSGSSNSDSVRTARLVPLAALYAASMLLAHCAGQLQSEHGTYLAAQSALPVVVMVMMGSATVCYHRHFEGFGRRSPRKQQDDSEYVPSLKRFLRLSSGQLISQGRSALGWSLSEQKLTDPGLLASDSDGNEHHSSSSNSSSSGQGHERYGGACAARWVSILISIGAALAAWAPAYSVVLIPVGSDSGPWGLSSFAWARSLLSAAVSIAGVLVNAQLLVATSRQLAATTPMSAARLLRHFAPLCMLVALVLWPIVGTPVDAIEALTPHILFNFLGVAALGALANIARVAMLQASVSDGALGVAVLLQARALICLAIGWWAYDYLHWSLQIVGFVIATLSIALWAALRLFLPLHARTPTVVVSVHSYRLPRSRKLSSASAVGWDTAA
ncbi:hypothetical protein GGI21_000215, partial [Coemansia aciculifera]